MNSFWLPPPIIPYLCDVILGFYLFILGDEIFRTLERIRSNKPYYKTLECTEQIPMIKGMDQMTNRLSTAIGGNKEMNKLYTTSQVSNITRKTNFSHNS